MNELAIAYFNLNAQDKHFFIILFTFTKPLNHGTQTLHISHIQMNRKILLFGLLLFLVADLGYSFLQHYNQPFDGDMAGGIVPAQDVKAVLSDPFGINVLKEDIKTSNPNRFFCHWPFYAYFNHVPFLFHSFLSPISSAYFACAVSKTLMQAIIILLLALAISGKTNLFKFEFIAAAVLVTPLFQTNGYRAYMGIIDPATTYAFFYALPTIFLMLYFAPLFLKHFYNKELRWFTYVKVLWIPLALVSSLSGALNPGISLVVSLLLVINIMIFHLKRAQDTRFFGKIAYAFKAIPRDYYFYLTPISVFSLYSLFLGQHNAVDTAYPMSTWELYTRLPAGIYYAFTQKLGFPMIFLILAINTIIINCKFKNEEGRKIIRSFKWIGLFALVYIILLPLGGYRSYRPNVLRYDTLIPVTLCLMFIFAKTVLFIIKNMAAKQRMFYVPIIMLVLAAFTLSDEPGFGLTTCEREAIKQIAQSPEPIVKVTYRCYVASWRVLEHPEDSRIQVQLFKRWGIVNEDKLFYQREPQ